MINLYKLTEDSVIFRNNVPRKNKDKLYQYYKFISFYPLNKRATKFDLYLQKCWDDYATVHFSEDDFKNKQYDLVKDEDEVDTILELLDNANVSKKDTDSNILRIVSNDGTNNIKGSSSKNAWIKLKTSEDIKVKHGERYDIPLGIAIKVPKKTEAIVLLLPGIYEEYGILQEYPLVLNNNTSKKEWKVPVVCISPDLLALDIGYDTCKQAGQVVTSVSFKHKTKKIPKGTEICRFRIIDAVNSNKFKDDPTMKVTKYTGIDPDEVENKSLSLDDDTDRDNTIVAMEDVDIYEQSTLENMEKADDLPTSDLTDYGSLDDDSDTDAVENPNYEEESLAALKKSDNYFDDED